jgi:hypothetical protein
MVYSTGGTSLFEFRKLISHLLLHIGLELLKLFRGHLLLSLTHHLLLRSHLRLHRLLLWWLWNRLGLCLLLHHLLRLLLLHHLLWHLLIHNLLRITLLHNLLLLRRLTHLRLRLLLCLSKWRLLLRRCWHLLLHKRRRLLLRLTSIALEWWESRLLT